ncbi:hypothetical protein E2C01_031789 [Portunus trituberculatus]|uniref:Uncharacterized protein n=1 Tax=Portunus trituberculatus TaxID=210409 RepID=A0A5B7EZJ0_PORTR|nr:hypothetical protein [Portunus trituberculatus]
MTCCNFVRLSVTSRGLVAQRESMRASDDVMHVDNAKSVLNCHQNHGNTLVNPNHVHQNLLKVAGTKPVSSFPYPHPYPFPYYRHNLALYFPSHYPPVTLTFILPASSISSHSAPLTLTLPVSSHNIKS